MTTVTTQEESAGGLNILPQGDTVTNRHRDGYYADYARTPEGKAKIRAKYLRQAEKKRLERKLQRESHPRCLVCGEPFNGRALYSLVTMAAMVHQKCDPARWVAAWRGLKK